jgi:hypothetical protein
MARLGDGDFSADDPGAETFTEQFVYNTDARQETSGFAGRSVIGLTRRLWGRFPTRQSRLEIGCRLKSLPHKPASYFFRSSARAARTSSL